MSQPDDAASTPGGAILSWLHQEFTALRRQLDELTERTAFQEHTVAELTELASGELAASLAQMEGYAAELRNETARLAGFQGDLARQLPELVAEAAAPMIRASVTEPLPGLVGEAVRPEVRDALGELRRIVGILRDEIAELAAWRVSLSAELPRLVAEAVARAGPAPDREPQAPEAEPRRRAPVFEISRARSYEHQRPPEEPAPASPTPGEQTAPAEHSGDAEQAAPVRASPLLTSPSSSPPVAPSAFSAASVGREPAVVAGPSLAEHVGTSVEVARVRLRRRRRAGLPGPGLRVSDPLLGTAVRALAARRVDGRPAPVEGTHGEVAVGEREGSEIVLALDEWQGIVLWGPGSTAVARCLALSFLAGRAPGRARVVAVGGVLPPSPPVPGLERETSLGDVLDDLADELDRRAQGDAAELPAVLLVVANPRRTDLQRLRRLMREGPARRVHVVVASTGRTEATGEPGEDGGRPACIEVGEMGGILGAEPEELAWRLSGGTLYRASHEGAAELLTLTSAARTEGDHYRRGRFANSVFDVPPPLPPDTAAALEVQALGGWRLRRGDRDVTLDLDLRASELAAFLVLHPQGATPEDTDRALFGDPARDGEAPAEQLGAAVQALASGLGCPEGDLRHDGTAPRLRLPPAEVDLWELQRSLGRASAEAASADRATRFDAAVQLYTGELLAGCAWPWAEGPRDDLRGRVVDVLVWLADGRWAVGDVEGAARALERAVEVDPYAEQIYRRQMRLAARRARLDEVEQIFDRLARHLSMFGLDPTAETLKLRSELVSG